MVNFLFIFDAFGCGREIDSERERVQSGTCYIISIGKIALVIWNKCFDWKGDFVIENCGKFRNVDLTGYFNAAHCTDAHRIVGNASICSAFVVVYR